MNKNTYHHENPTPNARCHYCGRPATTSLVADFFDNDTGYVDSVDCCDECYEKEVANKMEKN